MRHETRYLWLDLVRGLSAVVVCAHHLRAALFVTYSQLPESSWFQKAFYFGTSLGHQAVMVFFVLSGFFVGGSILQKRHDFRWMPYATARLTRLWVVLIPAFAFTWMIDHCTLHLDAKAFSGAYWSAWGSGPTSPGSYSASATTLVGNLVFLQTILVPVFGSNTPLWSLANEFWYYSMFPVMVYALGFCRPNRVGVRVVLGLLGIALVFALPEEMVIGFIVWMIGAAVWCVPAIKRSTHTWVLLGLGMITFAVSLVYSKSEFFQSRVHIHSGLAVGLGFSPLVLALVNLRAPKIGQELFSKTSRFLSEISYSLYLFHFPVVLFLSISVYEVSRLTPVSSGYFKFSLWLCLLVAGGFCFWWLFERRTAEVRSLVSKLLQWLHRAPAGHPTLSKSD